MSASTRYFTQERLKNAQVFDNSFLSHGKNMTPENIKKLLGSHKVAMIALNYPIGEKFWPLWQSSDVRITDVGGSAHLCDAAKQLKEKPNMQAISPNLIIGNVDRLREHACDWTQQGTKCIKSVDETKGDLERCLDYLVSQAKGTPEVDIVLVYGALNPRLDKLLGNLSVVMQFANKFKRIILVDEHNISEVLHPGVHTIKYEGLHKDNTMSCGLFPLGGISNEIATQGLKWDLKGEKLQMGSHISRANLIENPIIHISNADSILFTVGCGHCHPEKQHMHTK